MTLHENRASSNETPPSQKKKDQSAGVFAGGPPQRWFKPEPRKAASSSLCCRAIAASSKDKAASVHAQRLHTVCPPYPAAFIYRERVLGWLAFHHAFLDKGERSKLLPPVRPSVPRHRKVKIHLTVDVDVFNPVGPSGSYFRAGRCG